MNDRVFYIDHQDFTQLDTNCEIIIVRKSSHSFKTLTVIANPLKVLSAAT